jgi:hypothetical protein
MYLEERVCRQFDVETCKTFIWRSVSIVEWVFRIQFSCLKQNLTEQELDPGFAVRGIDPRAVVQSALVSAQSVSSFLYVLMICRIR